MRKVLVVFGSKSDKNVFEPIAKSLKEKGIEYDLRICSAHRTPEMINTIILHKEYELVIAGAGLAAHLPGVVASKTTAPVVGVPCSGNFDGLDSFLSIVQMPPGIPVLSVGVDKNPVSDFILRKGYDSVRINGDFHNERVKKCVQTLEKFDVALEGSNPITINFFDLNSEEPKENCINVPLTDDENAKDTLTFLKKSSKGFFVGLNRGDNAAIFAVSMIDYLRLIDYREEMIKKVMDDDKSIQ